MPPPRALSRFGNIARSVAQQIARPGAALRRLVARVIKSAFLEAQATATDTTVEQIACPFERRDLRVDPRAQAGADPAPVGGIGGTFRREARQFRRVLESYGMPTESAFDFAKVVEATALDKKSFGKTLNLILLKQIGESVIHPVDRNYLVLRYKLAAEQNRRRKLN